jgi:hypothetical protein
MYGDHHQQPQKDCRYNEPDPFLVVREPCMRMIGPVHGQPTFHAAPNPTPYHTSYGLMTEHRGGRRWRCAILPPSGQADWSPWTGRGSPRLRSKPELGVRLFGMSPVTLPHMAASNLHSSGQPSWSFRTGRGGPRLQARAGGSSSCVPTPLKYWNCRIRGTGDQPQD